MNACLTARLYCAAALGIGFVTCASPGLGAKAVQIAQTPGICGTDRLRIHEGGRRWAGSGVVGPGGAAAAAAEGLAAVFPANPAIVTGLVHIDLGSRCMKIVKIPGETKALVDELREIRKRKKFYEKRETEITTTLKELTEQQPATLQFNLQIVAMIEVKSATRIDSDKLRANYPDVAKECSVPGSFLTVKVC